MLEYWNDTNSPTHPASVPDYLPVKQLREMQFHRLEAVLRRAYDRVALFRQRMDARGLTPDKIKTLKDIALVPFSVKTDLRDKYPFGLFASPMQDIVRLHASSGTTGKPIVVGYTKSDIEVWTNVMVRTLAACGVRAGDVVQNAYGYGLFTGGLGLHYGSEGMGATVIPISGGNSERQIMVMKDFGATVICCTPSYFLHLIEVAAEAGVDMKSLPMKIGIFGAEPWSEEMRQRIQGNSGIRAYDIYGLSEIIGPGVASECCVQQGLHIFEDHFYPEIINPETGEVLPDGEKGELVLTTLSKQAIPMIRYRTRDITRLIPEPCECGRTIRRMARVTARSDDMLIIRGVNVFPSQIEEALLRVEGTLPHYQIIVTREHDLDEMEVQIEVTKEFFTDSVKSLEQLKLSLSRAIEKLTGIRMKITLVEPQTIQRSEGKAKRVIDKRKLA
ncbi:MAG: phenylacetate--CoA ligase [bacterium]